jgi:hypothetical protein
MFFSTAVSAVQQATAPLWPGQRKPLLAIHEAEVAHPANYRK